MEKLPYQSVESWEQEEMLPSAKRAVDRVQEIYRILGPRLGVNFVEANVVLTLADARGQTEIFINNGIEEGDVEAIERLNAIFEKKGIHFNADILTSRRTSKPVLAVNVESLRGYAFTAKRSKIPGIKPLDLSAGWEGFLKWLGEISENVENEKKKGSFPEHFDTDNIITGIMKGYPDMAIYDASDAYAKDTVEKLKSTDIPNVALYGGAEPNYDYYPEHTEVKEIIEHQKLWGNILEDFYNSNFHENLKKNQEFLATRKKMEIDEKEESKS